MGMNSGEVVVGKIGDDLRMDYSAQGHTVGLAARMEQLAEPGRVYMTEETAKLVSGWRTSLEAARSRGFSRFVGRNDEMASFEAALAKAIAGNGRVVGVLRELPPRRLGRSAGFLKACSTLHARLILPAAKTRRRSRCLTTNSHGRKSRRFYAANESCALDSTSARIVFSSLSAISGTTALSARGIDASESYASRGSCAVERPK
jgi:hypothetical protein